MAELINSDNYQDFTLETLKTPDGITKLNSILRILSQNISGDTESVRVYQGVGTPEGSVAAGVGSLYMRTDGSSDTSVYRKESGSGDTGWIAIKTPASLPLSTANGGLGADASGWTADDILYLSSTGVISHRPLNPAVTLISNTTVSAAANTGDISITSGLFYRVSFQLGNLNAADIILMRVNNDTAGNYSYAYNGRTSGGALTGGAEAATSITVGTSIKNTSTIYANGMMDIYSVGSKTYLFGKMSYIDNAGTLASFVDFFGYWSGATPSSFRILTSGGATMSGNVLLYKLSTS